MSNRKRSGLRNFIEFLPAWLILKLFGILPRRAARASGRFIARLSYYLHRRLRRTGYRNLSIALPRIALDERAAIVKSVFLNMGNLLGEFAQFPRLTPDNIRDLVVYEGYANYKEAAEKGRGVLFLTGHFGAWELCAFAHGLYGHKLNFLVRPLDNPLLNRMIDRHRSLSGNRTIDKNEAVKPVLAALRRGEAVGFLIDVNTLPDQGVFCDFFDVPASTSSGLAVFALRTEAPVVPGFLIWDDELRKYRLKFEPEVALIRTGDFKEEIQLNTARFTAIIEEYARRYPSQWLWIHKRWKTRPEGESDFYSPSGMQETERPAVKVSTAAVEIGAIPKQRKTL